MGLEFVRGWSGRRWKPRLEDGMGRAGRVCGRRMELRWGGGGRC